MQVCTLFIDCIKGWDFFFLWRGDIEALERSSLCLSSLSHFHSPQPSPSILKSTFFKGSLSPMFSSQPATAKCEDPSVTFTGWAAVPNGNGVLQKFGYHPRPLGAEEVEIMITHCGVCGSDIHFATEGWTPIVRPVIPGHEIVGTVVARGDNSAHKMGDRVGVGCLVGSCRTNLCEWCTKGEDQFCDQKTVTFNAPYTDGRGGISQGGLADRIRVFDDYAFKIPDIIPSAEAASMFCAGITTYTPLKRYKAGPHSRVGVIGIG
ncbi:hypothetical protein KVV02_003889 [Mortierella alpina]|uniref:Alcohol dehydrogenase-like N-terminal domain-containing protein n=1 Tax=Mortierella alpina TaxID=64518 RepID=A0A9P7ZYT2_MORAP|nr:hypothetical protein KVV02_003889 [Mortierella alpina]